MIIIIIFVVVVVVVVVVTLNITYNVAMHSPLRKLKSKVVELGFDRAVLYQEDNT